MVVEENSVKELPFSPSKKLFVVKQEVGLDLRNSKICFSSPCKKRNVDTTVILAKNTLDIAEQMVYSEALLQKDSVSEAGGK